MLHGQKVVKVFSYEQKAKQKFDEVNQSLYENTNRARTHLRQYADAHYGQSQLPKLCLNSR